MQVGFSFTQTKIGNGRPSAISRRGNKKRNPLRKFSENFSGCFLLLLTLHPTKTDIYMQMLKHSYVVMLYNQMRERVFLSFLKLCTCIYEAAI